MPFPVTFLLLFPVAISVDDQEGKNSKTGHKQNDHHRLVAPDIFQKTGHIRVHFTVSYTFFCRSQICDATASKSLSKRNLRLTLAIGRKGATLHVSVR